MNSFNRDGMANGPCNGCTERYPACQDHCDKPEYKAWKEKIEVARAERKRYRDSHDTLSDDAKRKIWRRSRYSRN